MISVNLDYGQLIIVMSKILAIILSVIGGSFVYFFSKLFYFFIPGVDIYGGPNFFLFVIGHVFACLTIRQVGRVLKEEDDSTYFISLALYATYSSIMLSLVPNIPWYFFVLIYLICGLFALRRRMS